MDHSQASASAVYGVLCSINPQKVLAAKLQQALVSFEGKMGLGLLLMTI